MPPITQDGLGVDPGRLPNGGDRCRECLPLGVEFSQSDVRPVGVFQPFLHGTANVADLLVDGLDVLVRVGIDGRGRFPDPPQFLVDLPREPLGVNTNIDEAL
ncbi:MAG: hypothetical protein M1541_20205 [Acidobacteria bacterium]|nr:hypothetical protein [Acidobacteriota bacterium]